MPRIKLFIIIAVLFTTKSYAQKNSEIAVPYRDGKLWGLSDTLGVIKVKPFAVKFKKMLYSSIAPTSRFVFKTNKGFVVTDHAGKIFLSDKEIVDSVKVDEYENDYVYIFKKSKMGLVHQGTRIIDCLYDDIFLSFNGSYVVKKDNKAGLINSKGKLLIPVKYDRVIPSADNDSKDFKWTAIDGTKQTAFQDIDIYGLGSPGPPSASGTSRSYTIGGKNTVKSNIDVDSLIKVLNKKYDFVSTSYKRNGIIPVEKGKKVGAYSSVDGKIISEPVYDEMTFFSNDTGGIAMKVKRDGKFGVINNSGKVKAEVIYDDIYFDEKNKVYVLQKDNKKGIIVFSTIYDIIPPKYKEVRGVESIRVSDRWNFGLFEVTTSDNKKGFVGENGVEFFKN
ncbi:WG repeat-containing protein [Chryseobacterium sp. JUb7]|uniref:WG repeat-containing protein n=1 Tax=Chryseobacterium sp. JUb7 TaxID=2940599 RepID=UPI00216A036B|nr:WG repeat-containing protein [Chryseobacterium sp. JUb7]MCS3532715.1 hypothetical protein [Chryseobacterium sp. JUb7]